MDTMFPENLERTRELSKVTSTEELRDRVTVLRDDYEPAALSIFEAELRSRGLTPADWAERKADPAAAPILRADGTPARCESCDRAATVKILGWHRLWGLVPLFPRYFRYCESHAAK